MKKLLILLFLFSSLLVEAQQPVMLSMEGIGGEGSDVVRLYKSTTADAGFIVHLSSNSQTGNINTSCVISGSRAIYNKYSSDGSSLDWQKCGVSTTDSVYGILFMLPSGESIWGGSTTPNVGWDFLICRQDIAGNKIWEKRLGGSGTELLKNMIATDDGCYIMYGISYSDDGDVGLHYGSQFSSDLWAIKIDSNGNKVWSVVVGGSDEDGARSLAKAPGGGCYLYAGTESSDYDCTNYHGGGDALVARIGDSGQIEWAKCYGGSSGDGGYGAITEDGRGGAIVATGSESADGDVHNHIGDYDFWVFDVDSNGDIVWGNCFGGGSAEFPRSICSASDGNIWVGGVSSSTNGHVGAGYGYGDAWLVHIDSAGNYLSSRVLGSQASDEISMLYPLSNGMVMAAGIYEASWLSGNGLPESFYGWGDIFLARFAPWTTGVTETRNDAKIEIYPNPAADVLYVREAGETVSELRITDAVGCEVYRAGASADGVRIDVAGWPRGVYYVQVRSSSASIVRGIVLQ